MYFSIFNNLQHSATPENFEETVATLSAIVQKQIEAALETCNNNPDEQFHLPDHLMPYQDC